jgi:hypothetical protein
MQFGTCHKNASPFSSVKFAFWLLRITVAITVSDPLCDWSDNDWYRRFGDTPVHFMASLSTRALLHRKSASSRDVDHFETSAVKCVELRRYKVTPKFPADAYFQYDIAAVHRNKAP